MYGSAGHSVQVYIFLLKERKKKKKTNEKIECNFKLQPYLIR